MDFVGQRSPLFPPELHTRAARRYEAEAEALAAQIKASRNGVRRDLIAKRDQRLRNADFHLRLAMQLQPAAGTAG